MLLMVEKGIRGKICHAIYGYVKANNKYIKNYDKNKESSCLSFWDVNFLYEWVMSQNEVVNNFIRICDEDSDIEYFTEADVQYPDNLHELYNDLSFLSERMEIEKIEKLVVNLHDKGEYIIHIRNFKQALNCGLVLKKVHKVIKFHQTVWL